MKKYFVVLTLVVATACSTSSEKDTWDGRWKAHWKIDRNAPGYEGIPQDYAFEMNGHFEFVNDQVTISAFGYPKCIFQTDTSVHTQGWTVLKDTLQLVAPNGEKSLQYRILEQSDEKIRLQLVDDIFITLTK